MAAKSGWFKTSLNLLNLVLGSGLLAIPSAVQHGGFTWTLMWMLLFACASATTLVMIQRHVMHLSLTRGINVQTYQHAVKLTFGKKYELLLCAMIIVKLYGTGLAYFIVVGDSLEPIVAAVVTAIPWYMSRRMLISYFVLLVALPLSLLRTMSSLAYFSFFGIVAILYVAALVMVVSVDSMSQDSIDSADAFSSGWDLIKPVGIIVLAFGCHLQSPQVLAEVAVESESDRSDDLSEYEQDVFVVAETRSEQTAEPLHDEKETIQEEFLGLLSGDTDQKLARKIASTKLRTMYIGIALTMVISFLLEGGTGLLAALGSQQSIPGNVLNMYSVHKVEVTIGRIAIAFAVTLTYPLVHSTARHALYELLCQGGLLTPTTVVSTPIHVMLTLTYVCVTWGLSLLLTDVGVVLAIIGSAAGIMTNYFIPSLFALVSYDTWASKQVLIAAGLIAIMSIPLAVLGVVTVVS